MCECGMVGTVHVLPGKPPTSKVRLRARIGACQDNALAEHSKHCENVRADIAARTDAALKSHAGFMERALPIVTRRGRWGEP